MEGSKMSEGHLGVRIAHIIKNIDKPKVDYRQISDVLEEEAKKFPNWQDNGYPVNAKTKKDLLRYAIAVSDWFEKEFGSQI
jgi:hypothetical protein